MNPAPPLEPNIRRIAMACFATAGGLALLILLAWRLGRPGTGVFDLAASLVVLLLGLSVAAGLCRRPSESATANRVGLAIALGTLAMSGLIIWQNLFRIQWPVEEWLARTLMPAGSTARVYMNVESAFGCLLASLACLFGCRSCAQSRVMRQLAAIPALVVLILGLVIVLCYLLQSPFFEHTTLVIGAELSLLGLGLLLTAGFDVWPLKLLFQPLPEAPSRYRLVWGALSLVLLLGMTVVAARSYYFTSQKSLAIRAAQRSLTTIADVKAAQIADWRAERLADADYIHSMSYAARRALDFLDQPKSLSTERRLRDWLQSVFASRKIEQIFLLDGQSNVRLVHPKPANAVLCEADLRAAEKAMSSKEVVVADLHRAADNRSGHLDFAVPFDVRREVTNDNVRTGETISLPTDPTRGVLVLQVNASTALNPMLRTWPAPSRTAEAMLLRQDGDEVVCLNELRLRANTALTLRMPMDRRFVEARAVLGVVNKGSPIQGATKGTDYRGIPVVAVIRKIPNTSWVMVSKMDEEEVLAPVRRQAWVTAGIAGVLLGTAMLGINLLGRQRHLHSVKRELQLERKQRESEARFRTLFESSRDAILLLDRTSYVDCNPAALELFGFSLKGQLLAKHPGDLSPPQQPDKRNSRRAMQADIDAAYERGSLFFEWQFQRQDGTPFLAELQLSRVELGERTLLQALVRDITGRKQAEQDRLILSKLESTGILAGGIAHDFNNLLAIIQMNLDVAESSTSSRQELAHCLHASKQATLAAGNLTQQFITFAQKGAGLRQPTDLAGVIQEAVAATLNGSDVRSEISVAPDLRRADMDGGQIGQVIRNLTLNAREAMTDDGVVAIRAENVVVNGQNGLKLSPGEYVRVSVSDQGHGIPADVLPKIFDPYFSTKQRATQKGMGLGLTICHSVIQKHGGVITVDTRVGNGTTFAFYLPACPPAEV